MNPSIFGRLRTEQENPASKGLDHLSPVQIASLMNREDKKVLAAVRQAAPAIGRAIFLIADALSHGGRLFFVGAGTSGRLGVIEAAECPPTFGTPPALVQSIMAGGRAAVFRSKEGAEDSEEEAQKAIGRKVRAGDAVVGVAASGVTPFVRAALARAKALGARTALVTCHPEPSQKRVAEVVIGLKTGPEVLTGSTRLKAGTACKMVLNMLTTGSMVRLGKVYGHWMVDLQPKSRKLVARAQRLIERLGGVSAAEAERLFQAADRQAKTAIVMARTGSSAAEARRRLKTAGGFLRRAL
jgi:N-acetylmuramic acid 6-phosphate etherase